MGSTPPLEESRSDGTARGGTGSAWHGSGLLLRIGTRFEVPSIWRRGPDRVLAASGWQMAGAQAARSLGALRALKLGWPWLKCAGQACVLSRGTPPGVA